MQEFFKIVRFILVGFVFALFASSCLDQEINGYEEDALQKLNSYKNAHGFTEDENIGYGIYVKTITPGNGINFPSNDSTVLIKYTGKYTDGITVFETTDKAQSAGIPYAEYHIYGAKRHKVGSMIVGFDTAIRTLSKGAVAQFLIPHQYAYGNYEPVVYDVELLDVIANDTAFEDDIFDEFMETNGFDSSDTLAPGLYYKLTAAGDTIKYNSALKPNSIIGMKLVGNFAEVYEDGAGRQFYPRVGTVEKEVFDTTYLWSTTPDYPITDAIDKAIQYMAQGQTLEIACKSGSGDKYKWGYPNGIIDPYLNFYIISPYTPLHYVITLDTIIKP